MSQNNNDVDIQNFEFKLQEKMIELQWKSKSLEELQRESLLLRQELLNKEILLEDSKRTVSDLKLQLSTANQVIEMIEKEKVKHTNERIQLQINSKAALKERESLLEQTHAARLENMTLKMTLQKLTETVSQTEMSKKAFESSLFETQERFSHIYNFLQSNIQKLEKDHKELLKSIESVTTLNKRLQTVGLCTHAIYAKKNEQIKELQEQLASNMLSGTVQSHVNLNEMKTHCEKSTFNPKKFYQEVYADIEKDRQTDEEIRAILANFDE